MSTEQPYVKRTYRQATSAEDLVSFTVIEKESDLWIATDRDRTSLARHSLLDIRAQLESYIRAHPLFLTTLEPLPIDPDAPLYIQRMMKAGIEANVGPMAAVAGAVAEYVGRALLEAGAPEVLVENGGDLFVASTQPRIVAVFAGRSPLSMRVGLRFASAQTPLGVSTSSGTVGPSLSFGKADAAVVAAGDASLADAMATAVGNLVKSPDRIPEGLAYAKSVNGILGALIIAEDKMGVWGELNLVKI